VGRGITVKVGEQVGEAEGLVQGDAAGLGAVLVKDGGPGVLEGRRRAECSCRRS
jgi:hypothetical protein